MSDEDRLPEEPPVSREPGAAPSADDEALQREQGPEGDDPAHGLLVDEDDLSVSDRDLIEPGLGEVELGVLELGDVAEDAPSALDESGTPGGDESQVAAEELGEDADLVAGSEPVELPGATDDLFPTDEDGASVRDGGEEGLVDDLADALDDHVRSGDVAWRQSGPPDEADALGGELEFSAALGEAAEQARVPAERLAPSWPVLALTGWDGGLAGIGEAAGEGRGLRIERLAPAGRPGPALPPLVFEGEPQRVTGLASCGPAWHAATDRGMVFGTRSGDAEWAVADRYLGHGGSPQSWLPLGVSRRPFELLASRVFPGRVWAWRVGGPLLRWEAAGGWVLEDAAPTLRALTEDAGLGRTLVLSADEEQGSVRSLGPAGARGPWALPGDAIDVLLAPGARAAAAAGVVWLGCRDPELPPMRGAPEVGTWLPVPGVRAVRSLAALPGGGAGALVVTTHPVHETDELVRLGLSAGPPRVLVRARELPGELPPGPAEGSRDRIDSLVLDEAGTTAWFRSAGRVYAVALGGSGGGT